MPNPHDLLKPEKQRAGFFLSLRNSFFTGVVVAIPVAVTFALIVKFVDFTDRIVKPIIPPKLNPDTYLPFAVPGLGIVVSIVALWMLGAIASNFFGSRLLRFGENLLARVPIISTVYRTMKQIVVTMANQKDQAFKEVCLLEYPRKGVFAIGFITSELKGAPLAHLKKGFVCVFVPTTPNPTSGFLLLIKRSELKILDMTPEEGAKMIISGGMVASNEDLVDMDDADPIEDLLAEIKHTPSE